MHICPCSRALGICKNIGIRTYFSLVTAEIMGFSRHFAFCSLGNRLASFLIVPKNCIFWGASFELIKPLSWNPLIPFLHPTRRGSTQKNNWVEPNQLDFDKKIGLSWMKWISWKKNLRRLQNKWGSSCHNTIGLTGFVKKKLGWAGLLRVESLLKTDSGYPKDTGVNKPWQPLRIPFAITLIGQLHQSPPSPIQGT